MKITKIVSVLAAFSMVAACGGSDGGGGATATSTETKVAASAATKAVIEGGGQAVLEAIHGAIAPSVSKAETGTIDISQPVNCVGDTPAGGTILVTGPVSYSCTEVVGVANCTISSATLTLVFTDCQKEVDLLVGGTTYNVVLNNLVGGTTQATLSGTVSAPMTEDPVITLDVSGAVTGTVAMTGDVAGSVLLDGTNYTATGEFQMGQGGGSPTLGCTGTCSVTITEPASAAATQTCTLASDCNGCSI